MSASDNTLPAQRLTFQDDFSTFETATWETELPFWGSEHTLPGNLEGEYYKSASQANNPFNDTDGILTISATMASSTGTNPLGLPYNSGVITTRDSFSQLYGKFEVRAELPAGAGLWPAFWLMPSSSQGGAELDIFEMLGDHPNVVYSTLHSANPQQGSIQALTVPDTSVGFHIFDVDWGPKTTAFSIDGQVIATAATPTDMNAPMYMILNLAVGGAGSWPGAPTATTAFPAEMKIDYVRVEQTTNTIGWTDPTPSQSAPLVLPTIQTAAKPGTAFAYVFVEHFGNKDPGTPTSGVGVALLDGANKVIATGITNTNGFYTFGGLSAGTYHVQYITPDSLYIKSGNFANAKTGITGAFTLLDGQGYGVPYQLVSSSAELAGDVHIGNQGAANVTVDLLDSNQVLIKSTKTDSAGHFSFWTASGEYFTHYNAPADTTLAKDSLADPQNGLTPVLILADQQKLLLVPEQIVSTSILNPTIKIVIGNQDGGITLSGSSVADTIVSISDNTGSATTVLGTATVASNGIWSFTTHAKISTTTVHSFGASTQDRAGHTGSMVGQFLLADTLADTLSGTVGKSDVFAIMSFKGSDVINGFETSASVGSVHDYVNLSGRGITSFNQMKTMLSGTSSAVLSIGSGKTITLTDVIPTSLTAADFRFS